jgi:hypothetical protein
MILFFAIKNAAFKRSRKCKWKYGNNNKNNFISLFINKQKTALYSKNICSAIIMRHFLSIICGLVSRYLLINESYLFISMVKTAPLTNVKFDGFFIFMNKALIFFCYASRVRFEAFISVSK